MPKNVGDRARPRRWIRRTVIAAIVAVGMLIGVVAAYLGYLNHTVTENVKHAALLPAELKATAANPQPGQPVAATRPMTFLLIGSDERLGEDRQRSDVIIVAHGDAARQKVYLIHFPRDLYVEIPGRRGRDKINHSYRYGGMPLLAATVNKLTGIKVDHAAQIDFERFSAMTDAVGGVDVDVEEASPPDFVKGRMHMDGEKALLFVRQRKMLSEGDISRGRREQAFLKALMLKALSKDTLGNPMQFARFVDAATKNVTVDDDLSIADLRSEALNLRNLRGNDIVFITAPLGRFFNTSSGMSVIAPDQPRMNELGKAVMADQLNTYTP